MTSDYEEGYASGYDDGYDEGLRDGESNARLFKPSEFIEKARRLGLPVLMGFTVRWDAATDEVVLEDQAEEVARWEDE